MTREADEMRDLIRDAHAAAKDLRRLLRDVERITGAEIDRQVDDRVTNAVKTELAQLAEGTRLAMDAAVERVNSQFDRLTNLFMHGNPSGKGDNLLDVAVESALARLAKSERIQVTAIPKDGGRRKW